MQNKSSVTHSPKTCIYESMWMFDLNPCIYTCKCIHFNLNHLMRHFKGNEARPGSHCASFLSACCSVQTLMQNGAGKSNQSSSVITFTPVLHLQSESFLACHCVMTDRRLHPSLHLLELRFPAPGHRVGRLRRSGWAPQSAPPITALHSLPPSEHKQKFKATFTWVCYYKWFEH